MHKAVVLVAALTTGAWLGGSDLAIAREAVRDTIAAMDLAGDRVNAHLEDGVVVLEGKVANPLVKWRMEAELRKLDGVAGVRNEIVIHR